VERALVDVAYGAVGFLVFAALAIGVLLLRQRVLRRRGATLQCGLRVRAGASSFGWHTGMARYTAEDLQWFRLLSIGFQPRWTFVRRSIEIGNRRYPHGAELLAVPHGAAVITCNVIARNGRSMDVELAMSEAAATGFLAWIESSAPGAHTHPDTRV
jgi:Protein of unknown function (DUF2550)